MANRRAWPAAVIAAVCALPAGAQTPQPSPSSTPRHGETSLQQATPPAGPRSGLARAKRSPVAAGKPSRAGGGGLEGVRALEIRDGQARLLVGGVEQVVSPGAVIGTDTVKSITPGRVVLRRAAAEAGGGEAIVIVQFDAQGRTVVQVIATKDPTAHAPAEVK